MGSFTSIIVKEIKELIRDPKILFGVVLLPLLLYPLMGQGIQISQEAVQTSIKGAKFSLYTDDTGPIADVIVKYVTTNNTVTRIQADNLPDALVKFKDSDSVALVYVPNGYNYNITNGGKGTVKIYGNLKNLNIAEATGAEVAGNIVNVYNYYYSLAIIKGLAAAAGDSSSAVAIHDPIRLTYASIIKGNVVEVSPSQVTGLIMSQSIMLPIMVMMMVIFAIQMAATSIALEKEQKTLETLMTLPVGRLTILAGKLTGSVVIAIAGSISYIIGFSYYTNSAFSFAATTTSVDLTGAGIGIQPLGYALLGIVMFVTLVSALALAISLAVFTDSVRSAQSLTGVLIIPLDNPRHHTHVQRHRHAPNGDAVDTPRNTIHPHHARDEGRLPRRLLAHDQEHRLHQRLHGRRPLGRCEDILYREDNHVTLHELQLREEEEAADGVSYSSTHSQSSHSFFAIADSSHPCFEQYRNSLRRYRELRRAFSISLFSWLRERRISGSIILAHLHSLQETFKRLTR